MELVEELGYSLREARMRVGPQVRPLGGLAQALECKPEAGAAKGSCGRSA